jgi:hypothetical protein
MTDIPIEPDDIEHEMYIDTPAYAAAISQLAKALAELDPVAVHELLQEENGAPIMDDLFVVIAEQHPAFEDVLRTLRT